MSDDTGPLSVTGDMVADRRDRLAANLGRAKLETWPTEGTEAGQLDLWVADKGRFDDLADELDSLAAVPTELLAGWVTSRGRCLWETTFGDPPEWTAECDPDRELANRLCAGCPVRAECLEFELRVGGLETVGVWGALNEDDRRALHKVWSCRRRADLEALPDENGDERA